MLLGDRRFRLGEGPLWCPLSDRFLLVDIEGQLVMRFDPSTGALEEIPVPSRVGTVVPCSETKVGVALESGFATVDFSNPDAPPVSLAEDPEPHCMANRFNECVKGRRREQGKGKGSKYSCKHCSLTFALWHWMKRYVPVFCVLQREMRS